MTSLSLLPANDNPHVDAAALEIFRERCRLMNLANLDFIEPPMDERTKLVWLGAFAQMALAAMDHEHGGSRLA